MAILEITSIKYCGGTYSSAVILDEYRRIIIPPSLYLAELSIRGRSQNTITNYAYRLNTFFEILANSSPPINWNNVTQLHIDIYLNRYLRDTLLLNSESIKGHIASIAGFYNYAWKFGLSTEPSAFSYVMQKTNNDLITGENNALLEKYIPIDKFNFLLSFIDNKSDFLQERDELIFSLGYFLGLRAAEVVDSRNLLLPKLWDKGKQIVKPQVVIIGKGEKVRKVTIPYNLQQKIKYFILGRRSKVKGELLICNSDGLSLNRSIPSKKFTTAAKLTKQSFFNNRSFHSLRHSFATNLVIDCYEKGFDPWTVVPEQMGHENYETTFNYIFFEALLNKRHSILKKLSVTAKDFRKKLIKKASINEKF